MKNKKRVYSYLATSAMAALCTQAAFAAPVAVSTATPTQNATYQVQKNDSLWKIANAAYGDGSLYNYIASANGIHASSTLAVGQILYIPAYTQAVASTSTTGVTAEPASIVEAPSQYNHNNVYVVQKGDTLFNIAQRAYGDSTAYRYIVDATPGISSSSTLSIGDKIIIPRLISAEEASIPTNDIVAVRYNAPEPAMGMLYEVQAGDTLHNIAERVYGHGKYRYIIAEASAMGMNDDISIGRILEIPYANISAEEVKEAYTAQEGEYKVQAGDTLYNISIRAYGSADYISHIVQANSHIYNENTVLEVGSGLIIPYVDVAAGVTANAVQPSMGTLYEVQAGDTLYNIAERAYGHGKYAYLIADASAMKVTDKIYVGRVLEIPYATISASDAANELKMNTLYEVQAGDTLYNIAQRVYGHGSYASYIAKASGQGVNDPITVGRVLEIPYVDIQAIEAVIEAAQPKQGTLYTVQSGDTLFNIAERAYGNGNYAYLIAQASGQGVNDSIYVGRILEIPYIPEVTQTYIVETQTPQAGPQPQQGTLYSVQSGDTLFNIAERAYGNGNYAYLIAQASGQGVNDSIYVGRILEIPYIPEVTQVVDTTVTTQEPVVQQQAQVVNTATYPTAGHYHTVAVGDTLWNIADRAYGNGKYHTSIMQANGMGSSTALTVGSSIYIPTL